MKVQDIAPQQLLRQLRGNGLKLRTGPVVNCIRTPLETVAQGIALHYAAHPVEAEDAYADFHVSVERPRSHRRWYQPQVVFGYDGARPFTPLPAHQSFPLLEWGLNWCMCTRHFKYLTTHSAVLEKNGLALILPAPSGAGKSTLCAGLAFRGWRLLSDEMALFDPMTGAVQALPRPISLKNRSIDVLRAFAPEAVFSPTVPDTLKGSVAHVRPPAEGVLRSAQTATPRWIVLPQFVAGAPAVLTPMPRSKAFMTLMDHCFNTEAFGREGFEALTRIVDGCEAYHFSYGHLDDAVRAFDELAARARPLP